MELQDQLSTAMAELQKKRITKLDKRYGPRTEERKQQMKLTRCDNPGARDFVIRPEDGVQLRATVQKSEDFYFQTLIDEWRSFKW